MSVVFVRREGGSVTVRASRPVVIVSRTGTRGAPGVDSGSAVLPFEHVQASASASWNVNHNLGRRPIVSVYSIGGVEITADVVHISVNQLQVNFAAPFAGFARLI